MARRSFLREILEHAGDLLSPFVDSHDFRVLMYARFWIAFYQQPMAKILWHFRHPIAVL
jgi:hypothetical protein